MDPYDSEKVAISIKLYSEVLASKNNTEIQSELRRKASEMLGVKFNGDELYNELMEYCNPRLYTNPYNGEYLNIVNPYYPEIENNKDDYVELEKIKDKLAWFIDKRKIEIEQKRKAIEDVLNEQKENPSESWIEATKDYLGADWEKYVEKEYGGNRNE